MRRLYYTLGVLLLCALAALGVRWFRPPTVPPKVSGAGAAGWHLVDPDGVLVPVLPLPPFAKSVLIGLHLAGRNGEIEVVEAQTRLPGWLLRLVPVNGFAHYRSEWDLCLVRQGVREGQASLSSPEPPRPGRIVAWLPGTPEIRAVLTGANPFEFSSFCPGDPVEADLPGPSAGASLYLAAEGSPHLRRFLSGLHPERVEVGPDWADASVLVGGRRREVRLGAPGGPPGKARRLTLRLRYQDDARGVPSLIRRFLPEGVLSGPIRRIEAECRAVEGGEQCEGRLTLTF
jgi:hypothetical protein